MHNWRRNSRDAYAFCQWRHRDQVLYIVQVFQLLSMLMEASNKVSLCGFQHITNRTIYIRAKYIIFQVLIFSRHAEKCRIIFLLRDLVTISVHGFLKISQRLWRNPNWLKAKIEKRMDAVFRAAKFKRHDASWICICKTAVIFKPLLSR